MGLTVTHTKKLQAILLIILQSYIELWYSVSTTSICIQFHIDSKNKKTNSSLFRKDAYIILKTSKKIKTVHKILVEKIRISCALKTDFIFNISASTKIEGSKQSMMIKKLATCKSPYYIINQSEEIILQYALESERVTSTEVVWF